jgi:hypothetical protein
LYNASSETIISRRQKQEKLVHLHQTLGLTLEFLYIKQCASQTPKKISAAKAPKIIKETDYRRIKRISSSNGVGYAVQQLVEALRYKPEVGGFDSLWGRCDFSFTLSFRSHYGLGVDPASNKGCLLGVRAAGA